MFSSRQNYLCRNGLTAIQTPRFRQPKARAQSWRNRRVGCYMSKKMTSCHLKQTNLDKLVIKELDSGRFTLLLSCRAVANATD